jgi:hypothetical protein
MESNLASQLRFSRLSVGASGPMKRTGMKTDSIMGNYHRFEAASGPPRIFVAN